MPSHLRLLTSSLAMTSLLALAACSGAKAQLVEEDPSQPTTVPSSGASNPGAASSGAQPGGGSGSSSGGSSSGSSSGGSSSGSSGGGGKVGTPAPMTCPAGGVTEDGTNQKRPDAIAFTDAACGTVLAGSQDWWKYALPSSATKLAFEFSGKVDLEITSQGDTVVIHDGTADGPIPFHANGEYEIQVYSQTGSAQPYVLVAQTQ